MLLLQSTAGIVQLILPIFLMTVGIVTLEKVITQMASWMYTADGTTRVTHSQDKPTMRSLLLQQQIQERMEVV